MAAQQAQQEDIAAQRHLLEAGLGLKQRAARLQFGPPASAQTQPCLSCVLLGPLPVVPSHNTCLSSTANLPQCGPARCSARSSPPRACTTPRCSGRPWTKSRWGLGAGALDKVGFYTPSERYTCVTYRLAAFGGGREQPACLLHTRTHGRCPPAPPHVHTACRVAPCPGLPQAGTCDGLTYEQVKEQMPHEYELRKQDKLRYR